MKFQKLFAGFLSVIMSISTAIYIPPSASTKYEYDRNYVIQTENLSIQSSNSTINGNVDETNELDNLDNGIMSMLNIDTEMVSNGYFG